jgi:NitT/TauT family transport system substrate-binding protein
MRRMTLTLVAFALLCIVARPAAARIVVGLSSVNIAFLPVYVTQEKGFFKDEGLDVVFVMFNAGATNIQALAGGDVQIMGSAFIETIGGRASGIVDVKNFWGISNIMPFQLYSNANFKSMKDAKGKRFAISRFGSLTDYLTRATIQHFGVNPKEVTVLQIGSTPARFAALEAGGVDASIVWFPVTEIAKAKGYNKLFDLKEIFPQWPYETFAARETWLAKEKDQVMKFLRAYQRGVRHTHENKQDAIAAIRKYVKMDPAMAPAGYDEYRESFPVNGEIAEKPVPSVIQEEFDAGRIKRKFALDDLIDRSFMKALSGK